MQLMSGLGHNISKKDRSGRLSGEQIFLIKQL